MYVYFIRHKNESWELTKRTSAYHNVVFHGISSYPGSSIRDWGPPAVTNANREPPHLSRSGVFVPDVFSPKTYELIVSETVKERLARLKNVEFTEVVFEQLVNLSMPRLGDFSWMDEPRPEEWGGDSHYFVKAKPDVPELHESVGRYYSVLGANLAELGGKYADIGEIHPDFGSFCRRLQRWHIPPWEFSRAALVEYPICRGGAQILREDAFGIIAPFLDLDYFGIAVVHFDD